MLISGIGHWAKIVGEPTKGKYHHGWSFDLSIDEETQTKLLKAGVRKKEFKNKGDEKGTYIQFRRDAVRKNGQPGKPYEIVDHHNNPWPQNKLIGNGSTLNVVITFNKREYQGEEYNKPSAIKIQVWDYVEFKGKDSLPTRKDDGDDYEAPSDEVDNSFKSKKDW